MNTEKRQQQRKKINSSIRILENSGYYDVTGTDISKKGLALFAAQESMKLKKTYTLKLDLPVRGKYMNVELEARVVHTKPYDTHGTRVGLEFTHVDALYAWIIEAFLASPANSTLSESVWNQIEQ